MAGSADVGGISPRDLVREAWAGVRLHPIGSALCIATFAAGAAAGLALLAMTAGARSEVLARLAALGTDTLTVVATPVEDQTAPTLLLGDARAIAAALPFVRDAASVRSSDETPVALDGAGTGVRVRGTEAAFFEIRRASFARGRAFSAQEAARGDRICVITSAAARRLSPTEPAYGKLVSVGAGWCRVIGVLGAAAGSISGGADLYLPIRAMPGGGHPERRPIEEVHLRIASDVSPTEASRVVRRLLDRRHPGGQGYEVQTAEALLTQQEGTSGILDMVLWGIMGVCLTLGPIVLAAQSWQGVRARTQEIAVRRTIGARREEILVQFLIEGLLIAGAGSVLGAVLGGVGSRIAADVGQWPWLFPASSLAGAVCAVFVISVGATIYPAYRAATLDPVAALRVDR